ncbi:hypothetical protein ANO11243_033160 [Dothideomycetidae sp. 11243]|nr:hypothetical protein ANO11243_033160 [fungal sp. No.11243]
MPAMLDDPSSQPNVRTSGAPPFPGPNTPLPAGIAPRLFTLRDSATATLLPFGSLSAVPKGLLSRLSAIFNAEIAAGDTYPLIDPVPLERFGPYWFGNFGTAVLAGDLCSRGLDGIADHEWDGLVLGSFYIKPNYPGRSSHVSNAGFLVAEGARGKGLGGLMGKVYIDWAARLGYTYSIFNLVYETNVASIRIWDSLGFQRVGRVKGCGALKSYPDRLIDAIVFGRDLVASDADS